MSFQLNQTVVRVGLLGLGLAAWAAAGKSLHQRGSFEFVPNAFSLKGSPFGRTLAMAMQGPVDVYFHHGETHDHSAGQKHAPGEGCGTCDEDDAKLKSMEDAVTAAPAAGEDPGTEAGAGTSHDQLLVTTGDADDGHHHAPGESCTSCDDHAGEVPDRTATAPGLRSAILEKIRDWRGVKNSRTNPLSNTEAHKFYIRMEVEKKLFRAYQMDPTNYACYGAYHLFLTESSLGTRTNNTAHARRLAEVTVAHCLKERENPIAMLTAAAASHDMVSILTGEESPESLHLATQYATVTRQSLDQFDHVSLQMLFDGTWDHFSTARQAEMADRARLLRKLHDADRQILGSRASTPVEPEGNPAG